MTPAASYRPMAGYDYAEVKALWDAVAELQPRTADNEANVARFLERNPGMSQVATDADGKLVGVVLCGTDGRRGYIYRLAVHPDVRGHGIGRELVRRALAALADAGIHSARATIMANNEASISLHEGLGFDVRHDRVVVAKEFGG